MNNARERTVLFHRLLNRFDASQRMIEDVTGSRLHVAITRFRQGLKDGGLTRAMGQYLTGLFLNKDDAVTDFVENVRIMGKQQDVLVSWARSADALKEELLVIQACLQAAGLLDERQPLDFKLDADWSAMKQFGMGIHYDHATGQVQLTGDVAPQIPGLLSAHLKGRLGFTLHKNHLNHDPRLPFIEGIIALESAAPSSIRLTCTEISNLFEVASHARETMPTIHAFVDQSSSYLRSVFQALQPEIDRLGQKTGTLLYQNTQAVLNDMLYCLFDAQDFSGAFANLRLLRGAFESGNAQKVWALLSAAVYMSAQVSTLNMALKTEDALDAMPTMRWP